MKIAKDMVQGLLLFLHEQSEIPGSVKAFLAVNPKVSKHLMQQRGTVWGMLVGLLFEVLSSG